MKRYKNLWDAFISAENFDLAARRAVRGKKSKAAINKFLANRDEYLLKLRQTIASGQFKTSPYRVVKIFEPKERYIYVLPLYPDHIVHHALINILGPIWLRMFCRDSYACIPGRGLHAASQRVMEFMRRNKFVLQCDIKKFYPSIEHARLMDIIRHKIADGKILDMLHEIVWSVGGERNLPIGNLTSQWLGNVYLNELDKFVKQCLRWPDYIRYCDDFCLFGNNARQLCVACVIIRYFLWHKLGLTFSKAAVRSTGQGLDYIGYRHFPDFILLRRRTAQKVRRRIINIATYDDWSELSRGQLASARGWLQWACAHNYKQDLVTDIRRRGVCRPMVRRIATAI
ncbi:MAG: hypothetical protein IJD41_03910 [Alphaproteobacteria bacterium]|nr:hypothetical protein [Alphaproteobacteria bacterium]MBQ7128334.1 hypothetical protein [Alphaproteobacteria bacterium]